MSNCSSCLLMSCGSYVKSISAFVLSFVFSFVSKYCGSFQCFYWGQKRGINMNVGFQSICFHSSILMPYYQTPNLYQSNAPCLFPKALMASLSTPSCFIRPIASYTSVPYFIINSYRSKTFSYLSAPPLDGPADSLLFLA
eukprot:309349_1